MKKEDRKYFVVNGEVFDAETCETPQGVELLSWEEVEPIINEAQS